MCVDQAGERFDVGVLRFVPVVHERDLPKPRAPAGPRHASQPPVAVVGEHAGEQRRRAVARTPGAPVREAVAEPGPGSPATSSRTSGSLPARASSATAVAASTSRACRSVK